MTDIFGDSNLEDLAHLYSKRIHPEDEATVEKITTPKNWDFTNFKQALIVCSKVGDGNKSSYYIPASHVPETIHIGNLRKYINELNDLSKQTGNEFSRAFMVDITATQLVAGKKEEGETHEVKQGWINKQGLVRALSIHTHPTSAGFSDTDYKTFIGDSEQIAMIMTLGESTFLTLKNTGSPNNMVYKDVEKKNKQIKRRIFSKRCGKFRKINKF